MSDTNEPAALIAGNHLEETAKVYQLLEVYPYDGSKTVSLHATKKGAEDARTTQIESWKAQWTEYYAERCDAEDEDQPPQWRRAESTADAWELYRVANGNLGFSTLQHLTIQEHELLP